MQEADDLVPLRAVHSRDSVLLWEGSQGQISNFSSIIMALIAFGLFLLFVALVESALPNAAQPYFVFGPLIPLVWMIWLCVVTAMHRYQLTGQRLRESSGVLNRSTDEVELYRVKDIAVKQPILHRLFGRGTIIMPTSDKSTPLIVLKCIGHPLQVADLIREHVEKCRVAKGVREID